MALVPDLSAVPSLSLDVAEPGSPLHQEITRVCREAGEEIARLRAENADLKVSVIAFGAVAAVAYARDWGLPDGHLAAHHYDILAAAGARMASFTRHEEPGHASE